MKKIIVLLILVLCFINLSVFNVYASTYNTSFDIDTSDLTIKLDIYNKDKLDSLNVNGFIADTQLNDYNIRSTVYVKLFNNAKISSLPKWENSNYIIKEGIQQVNIIIKVPLHDDILTTIEINGIPDLIQEEKDNEDIIDEVISNPSLNVSNMFLESTGLTYNINIDNKLNTDKSYLWSSSNEKIAQVSNSGLVSAISNGEAIISCKITNINGQETTLSANVKVGLDEDNAPVLSEEELDLYINDIFKLNVENKISDAKYSWKSSDKIVAKIGTINGKVIALKSGICIMTCTVTCPDKTVYVLKCIVNVIE
jgi:hypothetical protein